MHSGSFKLDCAERSLCNSTGVMIQIGPCCRHQVCGNGKCSCGSCHTWETDGQKGPYKESSLTFSERSDGRMRHGSGRGKSWSTSGLARWVDGEMPAWDVLLFHRSKDEKTDDVNERQVPRERSSVLGSELCNLKQVTKMPWNLLCL